MKYAVVLTFLVVVAAGAGLLYLQPWVRDVEAISSQDFASEMNALSGPGAPDTSDRSRKLVKLLDEMRVTAEALDQVAIDRVGAAALDQDDSYPTSALGWVRNQPPRLTELARETVGKHRGGVLEALDELASGPPTPLTWTGTDTANEQMDQTLARHRSLRHAYRILWARMRLAQLDANHAESLRALRTLVWLDTSADLRPTLVGVLTVMAGWAGTLDELRTEILEHHFSEADLAACEAILAGASFDAEAWKIRVDRIARGETLLNTAMPGWSLGFNHLNSRINRRRMHERWPAICDEFRTAAQLPADQQVQVPSRTPSSTWPQGYEPPHNIEEAITDARSTMLRCASMIRAERFTVAGIRFLIAIERHLLKHGGLPRTIDAIDDTSFQPPAPTRGGLVYRVQDDGTFILYAFGPDGIDDGGQAGISFFAAKSKDVVFTLPRESLRQSHD